VDLGDTITVEMSNGVQRQLELTGLAREFNDFSSYISREARGFITLDTLEWLGEEPAYQHVWSARRHRPQADAGALLPQV
jgi:hypothetical protein